MPPLEVITAESLTRLNVSPNARLPAFVIVCGALSVSVVPLIAVTVGVPVTPAAAPYTVIPTVMPVALATVSVVLAVVAAAAVVEAAVFVSVTLPPFSVMPVVLKSAWLFCASAIVMALLIVVAPAQPPAEVPFSVSAPAVTPPNTPPLSVTLLPATRPVIVAAAMLFRTMLFATPPKVSPFVPAVIV